MIGPRSNPAEPTKVTHISAYRTGGAGRAMMRISEAIAEADSEGEFSNDFFIGSEAGIPRRLLTDIQKHGHRVISRALFKSSEPGLHSVAAARSGLPRELANRRTNIAHLHWIGDSTVSIEEVQKIPFPVVWTAHDMWLINGAEHYSTGTRKIEGYKKTNRPGGEKGPDINRWTWERKRKNWKDQFTVVSPSRWLAREIEQSPLSENWDVSVIPYPINADFWRPAPKSQARKILGVAEDALLLLFGAEKGLRADQKGGDHIEKIIAGLSSQFGRSRPLVVGVFGRGDNSLKTSLAEIRDFSYIDDDQMLVLMYSAADLTVVPSKIDNAPLTISESMACGTPVAAYDHYGPAELIAHGKTGILSDPLLPIELGKNIGRHLSENKSVLKSYGEQARAFVERELNYKKIGTSYIETYEYTLNGSQNRVR